MTVIIAILSVAAIIIIAFAAVAYKSFMDLHEKYMMSFFEAAEDLLNHPEANPDDIVIVGTLLENEKESFDVICRAINSVWGDRQSQKKRNSARISPPSEAEMLAITAIHRMIIGILTGRPVRGAISLYRWTSILSSSCGDRMVKKVINDDIQALPLAA